MSINLGCNMKSFKKIIGYYKPYKHLFYADMFCALTLSGIDLVFPLIVRYLLDDVYILKDGNKIITYVIFIGIALLVMYIITHTSQDEISSKPLYIADCIMINSNIIWF